MSKIWTGKCSECGGNGEVDNWHGDDESPDLTIDPCPHCKDGKVRLGVPCEKCEGTGEYCERNHSCSVEACEIARSYEDCPKCTCTDDYRPLTEREVEELKNRHDLTTVELITAAKNGMPNTDSGLMFKGSPVKVMPCDRPHKDRK